MKNNKKTQRKLPLFLGLGLGVMGAIPAATLLATVARIKKDAPVQYAITFDKGTGTSIEGETKISFDKETTLDQHQTPIAKKVVVEHGVENEYNFVDWVNEEGMTVYPQTIIQKSTKLTATYADELPEGSYYNISFIVKNPDEYLTGVTKLSVPKGRTFGSINKPQPHSSNAANKFKGWALASDSSILIDPDAPISTDMVLMPVYAAQITLNWHGNGGTLLSGDEEIHTENNVKFGALNQPVYSEPEGDDSKFICGWFKQDPSGKTPAELKTAERWKASDLIPSSSPVHAYAEWSEQDVSTQTKVVFVQNESGTQPTVSFQGNTSVLADKSADWATINRPNPYAAGYTPLKWQYEDDDSNWNDLYDTFRFSYVAKSEVRVRPVMQQNLDSLIINGPTILKQTEIGQYSAFLSPTDVQTSVTWRIFKDKNYSQEILDGSVTIDSSGQLVTTTSSPSKVYIKAIPTINPAKFATLEVSILAPTVLSADYFTFDESSSKWYKLNGLFDNESISFETLDGTESTISPIARNKFNRDVYVGDQVTMIGTGFLNNCTAFNSQIKITSKNTIAIGDNFMTGCSSFNQILDVSNIQHFGNYFLAYAISFNNGSTTSKNIPLALSKALTIGDYFLAGKLSKTSVGTYVSSFNSQVALGSSIKTIGEGFLWNASSFNSPVNFPASLTSIGDFCMYGCNAFTNTVTVDAASTAFSDNYQNFCAANEDAAIYKTGFWISCPTYEKGQEFINRFPSIKQPGSQSVGSCYRAITSAYEKTFNYSSWENLGDKINKLESGELTEPEFCNLFTISSDPTNINSAQKKPTSIADFIGQRRYVKYMGLNHLVQVVATCKDDTSKYQIPLYYSSKGDQKATFAFEFINPLHFQENKGCICFPFNTTNKNNDYLNSTAYKNLTGKGNGTSFYNEYDLFKDKLQGKPLMELMPDAIKKYWKPTKCYYVYMNGTTKQCKYYYDKMYFPAMNQLWGATSPKSENNIMSKPFKWNSRTAYPYPTDNNHRQKFRLIASDPLKISTASSSLYNWEGNDYNHIWTIAGYGDSKGHGWFNCDNTKSANVNYCWAPGFSI